MTDEQQQHEPPAPNTREDLLHRARLLAISLREAPIRSLTRVHHDELRQLELTQAKLNLEYSYALDVLQSEELSTQPPIPEDDGMYELPADHDYQVKLLLEKVTHRTKGEVYVVGYPRGGELWSDPGDPPVKFLTHQQRVPRGNGWAARSAQGMLLADTVHVDVECKGGKFYVRGIED
jgi:hypothetical protein